ncbi:MULTISPECIES: murein hydrolase activator EnvC family protein [unclassified Bradyrhizobium]|uniref:murein hydrolase activator EnvC family protein n=1 Tax=unclassified Bradyrhizobium TaxID=2631580 RepID=UPI0028E7AB0C|nr:MULTISPECIES: peptidoglycan DD-metalloendopeptidase family protein [unclassified Bradyrhizobium]
MFAARPLSPSPVPVRRRRARHASLIALLIVLPTGPAMPQTGLRPSIPGTASPTTASPTPATPEQLKQREQELEAARAAQKAAAEAQERLKADIAALGEDRGKLNQQLIDVAAQVRGVEIRVGEAETRLRGLDGREQDLRNSLEARRTEIIEVLAALQRAGRRTPPALLVRPEDALQSLRTAMLLGSVIPEMRVRAEKLSTDLGELVAIRKTIASERDKVAADRDRLRTDQTRLAALVEERQRKQASAEKDMEAESLRATALAQQIDSLQSLITTMELDLKSAAKAASTASLQGVPVNAKPDANALRNPARKAPAIAFASTKGMLTYPVNGSKIREFGASDGAGGSDKGISLAARPGAQVTTPCDGWVVYAGPFRSYGQLLILNAGGGYHVLIAGMERISVNIGQFVQTGEPVATMGITSQVASILATTASQPVLYVEFRKDGTPIDPGPWWAANEGEKVRG